MIEVKNPFVLVHKVLSQDSGLADTGWGQVRVSPPTIEIQFIEIEVEDLETEEEKIKFLEKEIKVVFCDYLLDLKDLDKEIYLDGEGIAQVNKVEMKKDSVVLTIDLVLEF